MIRIGIKEFRYQLNNWLGALVVFIAASLVSSSCLIIYFPLAAVVHHSEITNALFITPLSFGLLTLFVVISGVIRTIGKALAKEHARLAQLGSNPAQLAQITAVQMVLVSSLGTLIGYFVALPLAQEMYHLIQNEAGKTYIPSVVINYQLNSFCAVWGLTLIITYVSSFLYSYHILMKMKNTKQLRFLKILKTVFFGIVVVLTISGILGSTTKSTLLPTILNLPILFSYCCSLPPLWFG
ncbi:FtsX-like permease family protein [Pediococcus acidilactici]|uniref:FtsX-like permease family protein n=3 Tax=Pediococcus acidilactici TaxID=1254 RepID=UPI001EE49C5F|nr:FtsX-like permease family protein [Pediococcus acidilactici]